MEIYLSKMHERMPVFFVGLAIICSFIPSILMLAFVEPPDLKNGKLSGLGEFFPYVVIFLLPAIETLLFQALPSLLLEMFSAGKFARVVCITLPFALGHIMPGSVIPSFINGISAGFILGVCYLSCLNKSHYYAIFITLFVHAVHNGVTLAIGN